MTQAAASALSRDDLLPRIGALLTVLLVAVVATMERGVISATTGYALSGAMVAAGAGWVLSGRDRLHQLSELYLWLAFIVSIYHLQAVATLLAGWLGLPTTDILRALAVLHVAVVGAAVWILGTRARNGDSPDEDSSRRFAAALFVVGAVVFWVGARTFPGTALEQVQANPAGHTWTSVSFLIATLLTLAGCVALTQSLCEAGDRVLSPVALALFLVGAVLWMLHLGYRLTVLPIASEEWHATAATPVWFEPWRQWAGALFVSYSVLAYVSLALFGCALLRTQWVPRWVAWTWIASGFVAAPLGGLPLFIHVPLWIGGIRLLWTRGQGGAAHSQGVQGVQGGQGGHRR
jgi:hypothetical protein